MPNDDLPPLPAMSVRRFIKGVMRGTAVGFAQTWLFMVGVPLAALSWLFEMLGELLSYPASWFARESHRLSDWHKDAIRRDIKRGQR